MSSKLLNHDEMHRQVQSWKSEGKKVVFTNGCFDILHAGHVRYLSAARQLGDRLVIGLNTDASVRRLKGPKRPVAQEHDRAEVLGALSAVDAVTFFDDDTPEMLIGLLLPDILVKGSDWRINEIAGAATVLHHGGAVLTVPLLEGRSTSNIIDTIIHLYCPPLTVGTH
jgi:rfaE bifunctional protein nucleotidyltransferase chain/domain